MTLTFVNPASQDTARILLYASAGQGKTTAALTAPGPILFVNADRPTATTAARRRFPDQIVREVQFAGRQTLNDVYLHIREKKDDTATVVLDTIGEAYRMLLDEMAGAKDRPTIQQYGDAQTIIDRWIRAMRDLPVNLVLVCHEEIHEDDDAGRIVRPNTGGKNTPERIMGQMDVVAYIALVDGEDGPKSVAQLQQARGRRAKDGTGALGAVRDAHLTEWLDAVSEQN